MKRNHSGLAESPGQFKLNFLRNFQRETIFFSLQTLSHGLQRQEAQIVDGQLNQNAKESATFPEIVDFFGRVRIRRGRPESRQKVRRLKEIDFATTSLDGQSLVGIRVQKYPRMRVESDNRMGGFRIQVPISDLLSLNGYLNYSDFPSIFTILHVTSGMIINIIHYLKIEPNELHGLVRRVDKSDVTTVIGLSGSLDADAAILHNRLLLLFRGHLV